MLLDKVSQLLTSTEIYRTYVTYAYTLLKINIQFQ